MNKPLVLFFLDTKFQDFIAGAYHFGFLLLFYELTGSLLAAGWLTAVTIVASRVLMFFIVPLFKYKSPIPVSSVFSIVTGIIAFSAAVTFPLWMGNLYAYFALSILFSTISALDQSFSGSIMPTIVERDDLYKANSLNGMFSNAVMLTSPLLGYVFSTSNFSILLLLYAVICFASSGILYALYRTTGKWDAPPQPPTPAKKLRYFSGEWVKTIRMITASSDILFCILIGVIINFIFAGISGPYVLGSSETAFGATLLKISIAAGSLIGVYGVYVLKVKDHYKQYIQVSLAGTLGALLLLANASHLYVTMVGVVLLTMFVMFIMNSTGTFLQLATPREELPSVYALRASIYAIVVPLSYLMIGWILEQYGSQVYFYMSIVEVLAVVAVSRFSRRFALRGEWQEEEDR